ncbi:MAG: helix-turn-helix transcriptional regulator [Acidobacteria bacterium]|nr:helix-turn-helix transcriptional regulator [Acidobacteriota bacterium]
MIKVQIQQMAIKSGYANAFQLQKALGISPTLAARLWRGDFTQIGLVTLDRLCKLLKCQTDKLIRFEIEAD